ncbi:MAG: bifunctional demethylmenaquinone methyltransferase/2-methoxy-6-polyprenyl,4-benzoquinol methylase [Microbacteriaceae bacterium]|jgi:demethylmenaquinone methyltransferase/2-methoxy-6-polyprenyl-1,4-benzoquinol methylase|nr:bifunctional demethylmenaquinone methyltransferase/2-methoxy-6-polyprenyl,4-benzoquinol methylase [Microbacteriaceae bacterium]
MFDGVARGYDRTNSVLSMGNSLIWRIATVRAVAPMKGEKVLDLAAGTGTSSAALAKGGAEVTAADFSPGMIEVGRKKHPGITFVQADAMNLPFADGEFDAATISFGLRNIEDPRKALAEMYRVLKPGGRLIICEFSKPPRAIFRVGYSAYMRFIMPTIVDVTSSNSEAYSYLNESIKDWPDQTTLSTWIRGAGFTRVAYRNLTAGVVALHRGRKPLPAAARSRSKATPATGTTATIPPASTEPTSAEPTGTGASQS